MMGYTVLKGALYVVSALVGMSVGSMLSTLAFPEATRTMERAIDRRRSERDASLAEARDIRDRTERLAR